MVREAFHLPHSTSSETVVHLGRIREAMEDDGEACSKMPIESSGIPQLVRHHRSWRKSCVVMEETLVLQRGFLPPQIEPGKVELRQYCQWWEVT